jgi:hypothetical protein
MSDGTTFVARRDILSGEEITVDYALFMSEEYVAQWACNCRSAVCRERITGRDYLRQDVQERYANHFSPLILRKL